MELAARIASNIRINIRIKIKIKIIDKSSPSAVASELLNIDGKQLKPNGPPTSRETNKLDVRISKPKKHPKHAEIAPVGLKEAALDSPSFRATAVHYTDQAELVEKWLEGFLKATSKLVHEVSALDDLTNNFLIKSLPPLNISEAIIDHDYTLLGIQRYGDGAREFWSCTMSAIKRMETVMVEPIRAFLQGEFRNFKEARRYLDASQKQFDSLLARFSAQSKVKEASALREDAFQLYEARKTYLKASMDFCILAPQVRSSLDKLLIMIFSDQWRDTQKSSESVAATFNKRSSEMERISSWSREMEIGEKTFRRELQNARKQIEEIAQAAHRPSRELDDYSVSTVPYLGQKGPSAMNLPPHSNANSERTEKQGWLFMKTVSGKPTRTLWIRRWFYVKGGIFGWLVQGARLGAVEESDRIGVLLCNIRAAFQEERRFCFEVKTKDSTILLQAETQLELVEWLKSFEAAKRKALEDSAGADSATNDGLNQDFAFSINPPSVPEFAARDFNINTQPGADDPSATSFDRSSTLPIPGGDGAGGMMSRGSFDVTGRGRSPTFERDGEAGSRDHAARIIQKLDLHRKSTAAPQGGSSSGNSGGPQSVGGIGSLISASHGVLPLSPPGSSQSGIVPLRSESGKTSLGPGLLPAKDNLSNSLAPSALANPPSATNLSKAAILIQGERGIGIGPSDATGGMPGGLMANLWGSSNWGFINRLERGEVRGEQRPLSSSKQATPLRKGPESPEQQSLDGDLDNKDQIQLANTASTHRHIGHRQTMSLDSSISKSRKPENLRDSSYPLNYPLALRTQEAQFRIFFPNVQTEDKLVLVFRATWSPNDQQEFSGRVYVTLRDIYFYSHHSGLVLVSGVSLGSIEEVTAAPGKECDFIFLHLREGSSKAGYTRIMVKIFLEPLRLLQRRLDLLVHNFNSESPFGLDAMINRLIQMESEDFNRSPSIESWEDVSVNTPIDDGSLHGKSVEHHRRARDLRSKILIDSNFQDPGGRAREREITRFKLPAEPIIYEPKGMFRMSVERQFEISPKALFHVMFGDKSVVFQLLYHKRRAQRIKQSPWIHLDHGRMRRDFDYQIDYTDILRRSRQADIVDHQIIDILNDHLCYVVTDKKTPWHLPHQNDFMLISKIVITYLAKSKCKLAIFTKVEWSNSPTFSKGIVERRGLDDLLLDAADLATVVADQVRRLGPLSRTTKAVQIFGQVGLQTEVPQLSPSHTISLLSDPFADPLRQPIQRRRLSKLFLETFGSLAESAVSSLMLWTFAGLRTAWSLAGAHGALIALLALSMLANSYGASLATAAWWQERRARHFMAGLGVGPDTTMAKAIYFRDLDTAVGAPSTLEEPDRGACYSTFRALTHSSPSSSPPSSSSTRSSLRLHHARTTLGTQRHDLLVAMRVLNSVERALERAEWESWLGREVARCGSAEAVLSAGERNASVHEWAEAYCASCRREKVGGERVGL
ncbi:MAG: SNF1-interacting protein [Trizodia sp. TS-e1964]|nr:MAG: SNF1-interacting protein [Trizodia sp. TS-e1964]